MSDIHNKLGQMMDTLASLQAANSPPPPVGRPIFTHLGDDRDYEAVDTTPPEVVAKVHDGLRQLADTVLDTDLDKPDYLLPEPPLPNDGMLPPKDRKGFQPTLTPDAVMGEFEHELPTQTSIGGVGFHLWEAIAYDIALDASPPSAIAHAYGITEADLIALQENQYFAKLLASKCQEIEDVGDNAETTLRFRMATNMAMGEFIRRLTSKNTADKDFHQLFRTSLEMAKLIPQPTKEPQPTTIQAGSGITFNLIGVPGLEHLSAQPVPQAQTMQTTQPKPVVIEHNPQDDNTITYLEEL